jgi:hypothetical protein
VLGNSECRLAEPVEYRFIEQRVEGLGEAGVLAACLVRIGLKGRVGRELGSISAARSGSSGSRSTPAGGIVGQASGSS